MNDLLWAHPWVAAIAVLAPLLFVWSRFRDRPRRARSALVFPLAGLAAEASRGSPRRWLLWLPDAFRAAALALLVIALARPQVEGDTLLPPLESRAIMITLDRSGSMDEPVQFEGESMRRLDTAKIVLDRFLAGDGSELTGRTGDRIGLIVFGTYADTLAPLSSDHTMLREVLANVEIPLVQMEQGTAIGEAIHIAAARLRTLETAVLEQARQRGDDDTDLAGKAIILLTDGENTQGQIDPQDAAEQAAQWGIRIYIIGIRGGASRQVGSRRIPLPGRDVNEPAMTRAAETTGGRFYAVDDVRSLPEIYAEIDRLEPAPLPQAARTLREERFPSFAAAGLVLLLLDLLLRTTALRHDP